MAGVVETVSDLYHSHPILWTLGVLIVGYLIGDLCVASAWEAERRRLRKAFGLASVEDYRYDD